MVQRFGRSVKGDVVGIGKQIRKIALPGLALCILVGFLDTVKNPQYDTAAEVVKYCRMGRLALREKDLPAGAFRGRIGQIIFAPW